MKDNVDCGDSSLTRSDGKEITHEDVIRKLREIQVKVAVIEAKIGVVETLRGETKAGGTRLWRKIYMNSRERLQ